MGGWIEITKKQLTEEYAEYIWWDIVYVALTSFVCISLCLLVLYTLITALDRWYSLHHVLTNAYMYGGEVFVFMYFVGVLILPKLKRHAQCILRNFNKAIGVTYYVYVPQMVPGVPCPRGMPDIKVRYAWSRFVVFVVTLWFKIILIRIVCRGEREDKI